jgi:uncharacterized damage-inducible protein DinB
MTRINAPHAADERTMLSAWLDWHRATVAEKCAGLSEEDAHRALLPTSPAMTVAGLVSHLRRVEHSWFVHALLGEPDQRTAGDPDREFRVDDVPLARLLQEYERQCARSREIAATLDLDAEAGTGHQYGKVTLRWVLVHLIEETARHNGHLDILRELLDGTTGF